jgi:hypothetical protein
MYPALFITTKDQELKLGGEVLVLRGYSDADFAGDTKNHKSTGRYVIYLEGAIAWSLWKQPTVALSSMES